MVSKKAEDNEDQLAAGPAPGTGPASGARLVPELPDLLTGSGTADEARERRLDEQEAESFPASDPHSDWAGPPG